MDSSISHDLHTLHRLALAESKLVQHYRMLPPDSQRMFSELIASQVASTAPAAENVVQFIRRTG